MCDARIHVIMYVYILNVVFPVHRIVIGAAVIVLPSVVLSE